METFIKTKQKRNDIRAGNTEKQYVENNLNYFINKNKKTSRTNNCGRWVIQEDRDTLLKQEFYWFTIKNFNLYELYVVFFNPTPSSNPYSNFDDARSEAILNISRDYSFTPEEAKRLKRKVWDLHPIFFGLIQEFINDSDLFWDRDNKQIVYPYYIIESK